MMISALLGSLCLHTTTTIQLIPIGDSAWLSRDRHFGREDATPQPHLSLRITPPQSLCTDLIRDSLHLFPIRPFTVLPLLL